MRATNRSYVSMRAHVKSESSVNAPAHVINTATPLLGLHYIQVITLINTHPTTRAVTMSVYVATPTPQ